MQQKNEVASHPCAERTRAGARGAAVGRAAGMCGYARAFGRRPSLRAAWPPRTGSAGSRTQFAASKTDPRPGRRKSLPRGRRAGRRQGRAGGRALRLAPFCALARSVRHCERAHGTRTSEVLAAPGVIAPSARASTSGPTDGLAGLRDRSCSASVPAAQSLGAAGAAHGRAMRRGPSHHPRTLEGFAWCRGPRMQRAARPYVG